MLIARGELIAYMSRNTGLDSARSKCNEPQATIKTRLTLKKSENQVPQTINDGEVQNSAVLAQIPIGQIPPEKGKEIGGTYKQVVHALGVAFLHEQVMDHDDD